MKNGDFWDMTPCRSCVNRRFGGYRYLLTLVPRSRIFLPWRWRRYVSPKCQFTRRHIPEDGILHSHWRENLKSYTTDYEALHSAILSSSVGIATGNELDSPGSIPNNVRFFSSPQRPDRLWGPPSLLYSGYRDCLSGLKRQGREAHHSSPSSTKVKKGGAILPLFYMSSWHNQVQGELYLFS
jgi:hypothetical protein